MSVYMCHPAMTRYFVYIYVYVFIYRACVLDGDAG